MELFVHRDGNDYGPFSVEEVKDQVVAGTIVATDHVWWEGEPDWVLISSVQEFAEFIPRRKPLAPTIRLEP